MENNEASAGHASASPTRGRLRHRHAPRCLFHHARTCRMRSSSSPQRPPPSAPPPPSSPGDARLRYAAAAPHQGPPASRQSLTPSTCGVVIVMRAAMQNGSAEGRREWASRLGVIHAQPATRRSPNMRKKSCIMQARPGACDPRLENARAQAHTCRLRAAKSEAAEPAGGAAPPPAPGGPGGGSGGAAAARAAGRVRAQVGCVRRGAFRSGWLASRGQSWGPADPPARQMTTRKQASGGTRARACAHPLLNLHMPGA